MGQYYYPICLTTSEWLYSHDYGNGLKLMEHSWIGNAFVGRIMKLLTKGNKWYKSRIVWCGDYAEKVIGEDNLYSMCYDEKGEHEEDTKIKLFRKIKPRFLLKQAEQKKAIIVNHTKKEYVKLSDCEPEKNESYNKGWVINPLPLLTALGNGGGGGDYHGSDMGLVGRWACDEISVEFDEREINGFTKLETNFNESEKFEFDETNNEAEKEAYSKIKKWLKNIGVKKRLLLAGLE